MAIKNTFTATIVLLLLLASSASIAFAQSEKGKAMSEQHKNNIANVVKDLNDLTGKDKNIDEDIRAVAQEQESSSGRATKAMKAVEARGGFKTFLIGTDYKNIGALRSEVVTTQNSINRLAKAKERAADDSVKADLDAQIKTLEETNTNALDFIKTNENKFNLFGWFVRLFQ